MHDERGEEVLWDRTAFNTMREGIGWWVRAHELSRLSTRREVADSERLGRPWAARTERGWEAVWDATGARLPKKEGDDEIADGELSAEDIGGGTGREHVETEAERSAWDRERCGVAMAARAGALWENGQADRGVLEVCGCTACCSRAKGWGWQWAQPTCCLLYTSDAADE